MIKRMFAKKKHIKFKYIGKYGLVINSNFSDDEMKEFLFNIYSNEIINEIMDYLKVNKEDQYERIVEFLEEQAKLVLQSQIQNEDSPIVGVLSENNNMGRS